MMFLLDQGLPRTTPLHLRRSGQEAVHAGDAGLATADDRTILAHALERGQVIVTLDADFHTHLALSGASGPSTVRIRIEWLKAEQLAELLKGVLRQC